MAKDTRRQFCERTLKYYFKEDTGERNYEQHEEHLQQLVEAEQQVGTKREREPMVVRYLKLMFKTKLFLKGTSKKEKVKKVDNYPKFLQQVVKEFPLVLANIHSLPEEDGDLENRTRIALSVLHEEVRHLLMDNKLNDQLKELDKRFNALEWKTFKTTARGTKTKEQKITEFLQDFKFGK